MRFFKPPTILLFSIFMMLALHQFLPGTRLWGPPHIYGGILPIVVGFGLIVRCALLLRSHGTTILPFEESTSLVTAGPYEYTRNPIYLGMVLILMGCAVVSSMASVWVVPPAFSYIIQKRVIEKEEAMLGERFGSAYDDYQRKVRRWV